MRETEVKDRENSRQYTTARSLLALLRLSQRFIFFYYFLFAHSFCSLAQLKFSNAVTLEDVDEAIRLMHASKSSLEEEASKSKAIDTMSAIYNIIRETAQQQNSTSVSYDEVTQKAVRKGYREEDIKKTIAEYEALNIFMLSEDKTTINFID
jgi:DNA replication licensing factor MCM7